MNNTTIIEFGFFNVRVCHPNAGSYRDLAPKADVQKAWEREEAVCGTE